MMSAAATKGVGLAVVSTLQSVGAAGMAVGTKVGIGATVYPVTSKLAKNYWNRNNKDSNNKANSEGQTPDGVRTETSNDGNASTARVGIALSSAFHSVSAACLAMGTKVTNGAANTGKSALNYFKAEGKRQSTDVESNVRYTAEGERQIKSNNESTNNGTIVNAKL